MTLVIPIIFNPGTQANANDVNTDFATVAAYINANIAGTPNVITSSMATSGSGGFNAGAMQNDVNAILAAGGGTINVPSTGAYNVTGPINITGTQPRNGIVIRGTQPGTQILQTNANSDTFVVSGFTGGSGAGAHFQNLWFQYPNQASGTGIAVHVTGGSQFVDCFECIFNRCPQAFQTDPNEGLQCGLWSCIVIQSSYSNPGVGQVSLGGQQQFVHQCLLRQDGGTSYNGGAVGNIGIVTYGADSARITDTQVSDFDYGVNVTGGTTKHIWMSNVQIETAITGLTIQPSIAGKFIYAYHGVNLDIKQTIGSPNQTPGVYIDTLGGTNTNTENINFANSSIYGWNASGVQINSARSVNFLGGMISSNGLNPPSTLLGCGVSLTNGTSQPSGVHLVGVDMTGTFDYVGGVQPYALGVTGGGSVRAWATTMTGQGVSPVFTTAIIGTPDIKLYNCPGYTDLGTSVSTASIASATPFTLANLGYYSKGTCYFSGTNTGLQVQVGGQTLWGTLVNNSVGNFDIPDARQQVTLTWTGAPTLHIIGG